MGYPGMRHFDSHAYRTEDVEGVKDFARGSMRSYLVYKEKARRWNEDKEIQGLVRVEAACDATVSVTGRDEPVAEWSRAYEALYPRYRELYAALKPTYDSLPA